MAKIKLYKFRPLSDCKDFERIEKILETGEFWCPKFTELNDPMEGVYTLDWEYREDVRKIYNKKTEYGICSFSGFEAIENLLMWGYYANGFKGVAIEIEVDEQNVEKVNYVEDLADISKERVGNTTNNIVKKSSQPN